jgi:hypothetical protein
MSNKATAYFLPLLLLANSAQAGWYEVRNYAGTIGAIPVHVSLQSFSYIDHGEPSASRIEGNYYYDAHRIPIPLMGQRQADGNIALCEATFLPSDHLTPIVPAPSARHPVTCPFSLSPLDDKVSGTWNDGKRNLPVALHQVGRLDDTGQSSTPVVGTLEIPMWDHTTTHLFLGIYESTEDCGVYMRRLQMVDMKSGKIDKELRLHCAAGTLITPIYGNVSHTPGGRKVTVEFGGGKMGSEESFAIGK